MTTSFCPGCGAEYQPEVQACPECGVLLADDALVYEMDGWEEGERTALSGLLQAASIPHRWDGDDLLVPDEHEEGVDALMDQVEFPDALDAAEAGGDGEEMDDEAVYAVMSNLFVAADRLARERAIDVEMAGDLVTASAAAAATPAPYGVEPRVWAQMQQLAQGVVDALEAQADDEVVVRDVSALRDLMHRYV